MTISRGVHTVNGGEFEELMTRKTKGMRKESSVDEVNK